MFPGGASTRTEPAPRELTSQVAIASSHRTSTSEFNEDLCSLLIACDIPLNKLAHDRFKKFMHKHMDRTVPHQTTLQKKMFSELYDSVIREMQIRALGKKIWISLDKTTDVQQRFMVC